MGGSSGSIGKHGINTNNLKISSLDIAVAQCSPLVLLRYDPERCRDVLSVYIFTFLRLTTAGTDRAGFAEIRRGIVMIVVYTVQPVPISVRRPLLYKHFNCRKRYIDSRNSAFCIARKQQSQWCSEVDPLGMQR